jgi:hypothetical protein
MPENLSQFGVFGNSRHGKHGSRVENGAPGFRAARKSLLSPSGWHYPGNVGLMDGYARRSRRLAGTSSSRAVFSGFAQRGGDEVIANGSGNYSSQFDLDTRKDDPCDGGEAFT